MDDEPVRSANVTIDVDKSPPNYTEAIGAPSTDQPPSYDSLYTQLRRAKDDSKNPVDYCLRACGIICGSLLITILFAISAAIPITMVIIGAIYKDQCPINSKIPVWLIVSGVVGCFSAVLRSISNCFRLYKKRNDENAENNKKSWIFSVIDLFLFIWLICGSVWVYGINDRVNSSNPDLSTYCHATCYYFSFWIITIAWIFAGLACCCFCCLLMCVGCGISLSTLMKN